VIFGAEDRARYGPPHAGPFEVLVHPVLCRPCGRDDDCPLGWACLNGVTVERVVEAAKRMLSERGA